MVHCHNLDDLAELAEWDRLSVRDKVAGLRVVAQGCTPRGQSVPGAKVAAVVRAANWAMQLANAHAIIFTDSQYAIDQWHRAHSTWHLGQLGCTDCTQQFPVLPRLELKKVKAHNTSGREASADAYMKWLMHQHDSHDHRRSKL